MRVLHNIAVVTLLASVPLTAVGQQARNTITNGDIVDMVRAGLSKSVIVQSIRTSQATIFDVSPRALIDLKTAGVPDDVLNEMLARAGATTAASSRPTGATTPEPAPSASPRIEPVTVTGAGAASAAGAVTIPDGTTVHLKLLTPLSSATAQEGDRPRFQVLEDVAIGDAVVIAKGAAAEGRVTAAKKAGALGRSGSLKVAVVSVRAADGSVLPVRLDRAQSGQGYTASAVTSVAADASSSGKRAAQSAAGELLAKGKEAVIPNGTEFTAFVDGAHDVTPAPPSPRRR
jgi:hypothetical protein